MAAVSGSYRGLLPQLRNFAGHVSTEPHNTVIKHKVIATISEQADPALRSLVC
jgi:hypothetical protein